MFMRWEAFRKPHSPSSDFPPVVLISAYSVTGVVEKINIKQNNGAHAGNQLILTKALGTGLITTALKRGKATSEHVQAAVNYMSQLNRSAAEICLKFRVDAMTDITGFGL